MKKRFLLLLFLLACSQPPAEVEFVQPPVEIPVFPVVPPDAVLKQNVNSYIIPSVIQPFSFSGADAIFDRFGIVPVERYDARYQSGDVVALVHVFQFSDRVSLYVVLNSVFFDIISFGSSYYGENPVAVFLSDEDHKIVVWSSGDKLLYVDTFAPFAAREILDAYLLRYPSDLRVNVCIDFDGDDHFTKGTTTMVQIGSSVIEWTDVCLKDFPPFKNGQYVSSKGLNVEDGLLEGRCGSDSNRPGFISEYVCHRGCVDGVCSMS